MIKIIKRKLDIHTFEVFIKSSASMLVKILGLFFALIISMFLGRTINSEGLGVINLSTSIVTLFITFSLLGFRPVNSKRIAIAINKKELHSINSVMFTSFFLSGFFSLAISIILILSSPWLANNIFNDPRLALPLMVSSAVMTPQVFSRLFASGLIGYKKIWQSNLVDQALSAGVTGLLLLLLWALKSEITINTVAVLYAIGRIVVTITVGLYWKSIHKNKSTKSFIPKSLLRTSLPILVSNVNSVIISSVGIIFLGWLSTSSEVGLYSVAERLALLIAFFLQVTNSILMPKIAALFEENNIIALEKMLQNVIKGLLVTGLIIFFFIVFLGKLVLGLWGSEFQAVYPVLLILALGQLINLATGPVGVILIMTGHEKTQARISIVFMFCFIFLNYILISLYGILGAAMASAFTNLGINITRSIFVIKKTGLNIYFPK